MKKDKFKSLSEVIMHDMTDAQRERLAASVKTVIADLCVEDAALLLAIVLNDAGTKTAVLKSAFAFFENEMQLQIVE